MKHALQLRPIVLAVSGALGLMAAAGHAQTFDPNSAAVRQAYFGQSAPDKVDAVLGGLSKLIGPLPVRNPTICVCITTGTTPPFGVSYLLPFIGPSSSPIITVATDGDLGLPGAAVSLNLADFSLPPSTMPGGISLGASFTTPRNFLIGSGGGIVNTNGQYLTILGHVTAQGTILKSGQGALSLAGQNVWNGNTILLAEGTLQGDANSLNSPILNGGSNAFFQPRSTVVEFNQAVDAVHTQAIFGAGALVKTGPGTLTLTARNDLQGGTRVEQGTLAIAGTGTLSNSAARGNVFISSKAILDFSTVDSNREIGTLSGDGNLKVGKFVLTGGEADTTFGGSISGTGGLGKDGRGTLTLTSAHTYTGVTSVVGGTLALTGAGRINVLSALLVDGTFDIGAADGDRSAGSLSGSGNVRIGANNLIVGHDNSNTSFQGTIEGQGGFIKTGNGTLTLYGTSGFPNFDRVYAQARYDGATVIESGTLVAGVSGISSNVVNRGTLRLTQDRLAFGTNQYERSDVGVYSGTISGTGQLIKDGDGIIWLRGRNTYTGGTTINTGALIGNTDSLQGNITNNAALAFYQVDNGTYSGKLSGSGTLLHFGPGVLTLTGNNTYTGGTVTSGTIRIDREANLGSSNGPLILAGGTLQLGAHVVTDRAIIIAADGGTVDTNGYNLSTGTRLTPDYLSSTGRLTKIGAGTLTFNRIEANASTAVQGGRLEVNNWYVSNVTVGAGAELGGSGAIVGKVVNNGRLALGNAIGQMNVVGDVTFEPGSVFTVKANAAGNSDRLVLPDPTLVGFPIGSGASARAILKGGTVDVRAESGTYNRQTRYNIINAEGGISGQFQGVTSNFAFLNPSLAYDTNNVYLTLTRNDLDYATVAQTTNQAAVARGLTRMTGAASGDAATVTAVLDGLSAPQARAAFDSIGAAGRGALPQVGTLNQRSVNQNLVARLGIAEGGSTLAPVAGIGGRALQLAFDEGSRSDAAPVYAQVGLPAGGQGLRGAGNEPSNGLWLRGYGGTGRIDGDASAPGAKYHYGGTLFGYDRKFGDNLRLGAFGGYAEPRYDQDVATSSARTKTFQFGGYGRVHSGAWHVDAVASYARNDTNTSRVVTVGALNRPASGSFKGDTVSLHAESGYTIKLSGFELQPLAALSWVRQTQNAYSETGAGALNLVLPEQSQQSLRSSLGLRTLHPFQAGATQAVFETRAAWSHEFKDTRSINARLAGDPAAASFTVSGPSLPRDSAVVGVGIAAQASRSLRLYADLNGEFNGRVRAGALSVGLRYQW